MTELILLVTVLAGTHQTMYEHSPLALAVTIAAAFALGWKVAVTTYV